MSHPPRPTAGAAGLANAHASVHDERWMRRAVALAACGLGATSPNPPVGAVLVAAGRVVGEGWHRAAGEAHAEALALRAAGEAARGATAYITLEPCDHVGRTPPCSAALIRAGVARVVYAVADPTPVAGGGASRLAAAGIEVSAGVLEREARTVARGFLQHAATGRPWVIAKYATSLDGRIATRTGDSRWITGPEARAAGHRLRHESDAIVIGVGTAIADDPALTVRLDAEALGGEPARHPVPVVLDPRGRTPLDARLLRPDAPVRPIVVVAEDVDRGAAAALRERGATLVPLARDRAGRMCPLSALRALGALGIRTVLVEGGADTHGGFADAGLVDEVAAFVAPVVIGGVAAPGAVGGLGAGTLDGATALDGASFTPLGRDLLVRGHVRRTAGSVLDARSPAADGAPAHRPDGGRGHPPADARARAQATEAA